MQCPALQKMFGGDAYDVYSFDGNVALADKLISDKKRIRAVVVWKNPCTLISLRAGSLSNTKLPVSKLDWPAVASWQLPFGGYFDKLYLDADGTGAAGSKGYIYIEYDSTDKR